MTWWWLVLAACGWNGPTTPSEPGAPEAVDGPPVHRRCAVQARDDCFVRIEGTTFRIGAQATDPDAPGYDPDARPDEAPVREVRVDTFWIHQRELRPNDWALCVEAGACTRTDAGAVSGPGAVRETLTGITWHEAKAICTSMGARLPTEAEWELAARGTDGRRFPWGDTPPCGLGQAADPFATMPRDAWTRIPGCQDAATPQTPRGASAYGLRDMAWGAWEWVEDAYGPYGGGPATPRRVQRGGAWTSTDPVDLRAAARSALSPDTRTHDAGARCAW